MFLSNEDSDKEFEVHPKGICKGVCVEVVTHNKKTREPFTKVVDGKARERVILIFQTEKTRANDDGSVENLVYWDWHNIPQSIKNDSSSLHKRLKEWEVPFEDGFDSIDDFRKAVVGRPATLVFSHNTSDKTGKLYANIGSCIAAEEGEPVFRETNYKHYNE